MRNVSADLTAAQKAPTAIPYVRFAARDWDGAKRRHRLTSCYAGAEPPAPHCSAFTATPNTLHSCRVDASNQLMRRRVTNPTKDSTFSTWTPLDTNRGPTAIAPYSTQSLVIVSVAHPGGKEVHCYESTNDGIDWTDHGAVFTAPAVITHIAVSAKSNGDLVVFFDNAYKVRRIHRTSSTWGAQADWTNNLGYISGIAALHSGDHNLIVTGVDPTTADSVAAACIYGDGYSQAAGTWSDLWDILRAAYGTAVTYACPFYDMPSTTGAYTLREIYSGTGAYDRIMIGHFTLADWIARPWTDPRPFDLDSDYGLAVAKGDSGLWATNAHRVFYPGNTGTATYYEDAIIALHLKDKPFGLDGGSIVLDNADGSLNPGQLATGVNEGLRPGGEIIPLLGYRTPAGDKTVVWTSYSIRSIEHVRRGHRAAVILHLDSIFALVDRPILRETSWAPGTFNVWQLTAFTLKQIGLNYAAYSYSPAIASLEPGFSLRPGQSRLAALRDLLDTTGDRPRGGTYGSVEGVYPQASDDVDYAYGTDHPIAELALRHATRPPIAHTLGVDADGDPILGQAINFGLTEQSWDLDVQFRRVATTNPIAADIAAEMLRRADYHEYPGHLRARATPALQPWDVISITDAPLGLTAEKRRVRAVELIYDRQRRTYDTIAHLGGV